MGPSQRLCAECYNRGYMKRTGPPELEASYFELITRRCSRAYDADHIRRELLLDRYLTRSCRAPAT